MGPSANFHTLTTPRPVSIHSDSVRGSNLGGRGTDRGAVEVGAQGGGGWNRAVGFSGRKLSPSQTWLRIAVARDGGVGSVIGVLELLPVCVAWIVLG